MAYNKLYLDLNHKIIHFINYQNDLACIFPNHMNHNIFIQPLQNPNLILQILF